MDVNTYLKRIDYQGEIEPTAKVLAQLQRQHLLHVPFENLDIHYHRKIELGAEAFYHKVVMQGRGGFCYELNGLFYELLYKLGFEVRRISARVYHDDGSLSPEYDHLALLVKASGQSYLVDVGFGRFAIATLPLSSGSQITDSEGTFVLDQNGDSTWQVSIVKDNKKTPHYLFTESPRELEEFASMCRYHQTDPKSLFLTNKLVSIALPNGRKTLTDDTLKVTKDDDTNKASFDPADFEEMLYKHFSIRMPNL